jgi:hypothetical protein
MRTRPLIIALVTAGIIAGTQGSMAAMDNDTWRAADPVTSQSESQVLALEDEPVIAWQSDSHGSSSIQRDEYTSTVRIPFTQRYVTVAQSAIPGDASELSTPLPVVATYFDSRNLNVALTGAAGSAFPGEASELPLPLPIVAAYFDRLEAQHFASVQSSVDSEMTSSAAAD